MCCRRIPGGGTSASLRMRFGGRAPWEARKSPLPISRVKSLKGERPFRETIRTRPTGRRLSVKPLNKRNVRSFFVLWKKPIGRKRRRLGIWESLARHLMARSRFLVSRPLFGEARPVVNRKVRENRKTTLTMALFKKSFWQHKLKQHKHLRSDTKAKTIQNWYAGCAMTSALLFTFGSPTD